MENEIYITRKQQWFDNPSNKDITLEEWMSFVKNDPEIRLDNFTKVKLGNGEFFEYENPGAAVYLHRKIGELQAVEILFEYLSGNIKVTDADAGALEKIRHIAFKLGAHVQATGEEIAQEIELKEVHEPEPIFTFSDLLEPIKNILPHPHLNNAGDAELKTVPETGEQK